ncbi:ABC transporter substrate-binding protein [Halobacterium salinarum]|uniref:ABC transporter substrate-binding protein n=1 Tax=Halobacterium salinarum TaxID=2242 RepID=UPI00255737C3|nr:PotD/PotF family extracellular solute-binding protein [Halobacterium salinarum]MDL0126705.1 PotD/PotF family extracellular solute-binding protein [Halobacterium salinarum]
MTDHTDLSRRQYVKTAALSAAATTALAGCMGGLDDGGDASTGDDGAWRDAELEAVPAAPDDRLYSADNTQSSGETIRHLTWSGYEAANVQRPFEKKFDCQTGVDLFTSNLDAFNRLDDGAWREFDHATFDMAWLPDLAEAGLIRPLDYEAWKPYTFDKYTDLFQRENGYEFAFLDEDYNFDADGQLYGVPQRFGWASFALNTDVVSESDARSYDAAWADEYDVGVYDLPFWGVQIVMLREGIDPYATHTDAEVERIREATVALFENAAGVYADVGSLNTALAAGDIDIAFVSGNWINGSLRRGGRFEYEARVPDEGGVIWVETTTMLKGSHPSVSTNYLAYMQHGITAKNLMWPTIGGTNVVPHQSSIDRLNRRQRTVLRIDDLQDIIDKSRFYTGVPDLDRLVSVWEDAKAEATG